MDFQRILLKLIESAQKDGIYVEANMYPNPTLKSLRGESFSPMNPAYNLHNRKTMEFIVTLSKSELSDIETFMNYTLGKDKQYIFYTKDLKETKEEAKEYNYIEIKKELEKTILGQQEVINEVMKKMLRYNFKLKSDTKKPLSFFWAGPTGVGKTETAKQLAKQFDMELIRIDMSEYQKSHNISRLIGSPPGYIGFGQKGVLHQADGKRCLLLVDEIEKADSSIYAVFLQALDYGVITEGTGEKIDLSKCVIVMTSNVGAEDLVATDIGVVVDQTEESRDKIVRKAMAKKFAPEFINRLSSIQVFNALSTEIVKQIVDNRIEVIVKDISEDYDVDIDVSDELREKLYKESYNPSMGARPIARAFERLLLEPTAENILLGEKGFDTVKNKE